MPLPTGKFRGYTFTVNNYLPEDEEKLRSFEDCVYLIYAREVAPKTGTLHLQGYVYFKTQRYCGVLSRILPSGAHIEAAKGNPYQNRDYCKKSNAAIPNSPEDIYEFGECPIGGMPKGDTVRIDKNKKKYEMMQEYTLGQLSSTGFISPNEVACLQKAIEVYAEEKRRANPPVAMQEMHFYWLTGSKSGTGKTSTHKRLFPNAFLKDPSNRWFPSDIDIYNEIVFQEYSLGCGFPVSLLKQLCDYTPAVVEFKGGMRVIRPKIIIVTSNFTIDQCFQNAVDADALHRRFETIPFPNLDVITGGFDWAKTTDKGAYNYVAPTWTRCSIEDCRHALDVAEGRVTASQDVPMTMDASIQEEEEDAIEDPVVHFNIPEFQMGVRE